MHQESQLKKILNIWFLLFYCEFLHAFMAVLSLYCQLMVGHGHAMVSDVLPDMALGRPMPKVVRKWVATALMPVPQASIENEKHVFFLRNNTISLKNIHLIHWKFFTTRIRTVRCKSLLPQRPGALLWPGGR